MRLVVALAIVAIGAAGCAKKKSNDESAAGSAGSAVVAPPADATATLAADAAGEADAVAAIDAAAAATADTVTLASGVATMSFGDKNMKVTLTLPEGWIVGNDGKVQDMGGFIFTPADAKGGRPNIEVVALGGIGPAPDRVKEDFADAQKKVVGGGKLKVLHTGNLTDGKMVSIHVDAKKERDIVYVETICFIGKADSKVMVRMNGFAEEKDAALTKTFEEACKTLSIVP